MNYYNEFDPKAAAWLRELIGAGLIPDGHVDERSILEVEPKDLDDYTQHHFFAGISGWSYALRLAGWPEDKPVWTASLPCQPFSTAGKGLGKQDERHLLPHFLELVKQCRPSTLFGEQVSAAIKHGWLDDLYAEMEACNYSVGSAIIGAHSIGAAHIRQRLYWVADNGRTGCKEQPSKRGILREAYGNDPGENFTGGSRLGDTESDNKWRYRESGSSDGQQEPLGGSGVSNWLGISDSSGSQQRIAATEAARHGGSVESAGCVIGVGNTEHDGYIASEVKRSDGQAIQNSKARVHSTCKSSGTGASGALPWEWLYCRDGKYRPVEPGILPLAHGLPKGMVYSSDPSAPINANATQEARVMRLKGYGNAIVPQVAAEFIKAFMEVANEHSTKGS